MNSLSIVIGQVDCGSQEAARFVARELRIVHGWLDVSACDGTVIYPTTTDGADEALCRVAAIAFAVHDRAVSS